MPGFVLLVGLNFDTSEIQFGKIAQKGREKCINEKFFFNQLKLYVEYEISKSNVVFFLNKFRKFEIGNRLK